MLLSLIVLPYITLSSCHFTILETNLTKIVTELGLKPGLSDPRAETRVPKMLRLLKMCQLKKRLEKKLLDK